MPPINPVTSKLKTTLKLSISRLRHLQTKESSLSKSSRRTIATLLETSRLDSARIRVENTIRQDIHVELLEILELYCELLLARIYMLEGAGPCDPGLEEPVKSLIYAAGRCEVRELQQVRDLLAARFGKEFAVLAAGNGDGRVAERVVRKLAVETPGRELVGLYLKEIARTYGVDYERTPPGSPPPPPLGGGDDGGDGDGDGDDGDGDGDGGGGGRQREMLVTDAASPPTRVLPKAPIHVAPASPSTENPHPTVRFPQAGAAIPPPKLQGPPRTVGRGVGSGVSGAGGGGGGGGGAGSGGAGAGAGGAGKNREDKEVDDLLARFAALKKR